MRGVRSLQRTGIFPHFITTQLLLQLVRDKVFVFAQVGLDMDLELDGVVKDLVNLRV